MLTASLDIGANASAEEASEDLEEGTETVNDVVYSFRLNQSSFDKKSYLTYLKGFFNLFPCSLVCPVLIVPFDRLHEENQDEAYRDLSG